MNLLPCVLDYLPEADYGHSITKGQRRDLGSKCLLALGFFYDAPQSKFQRCAAPRPEFYREVGVYSLRMSDISDIGINFEN